MEKDLLGRIDYCIEEIEKDINKLEKQKENTSILTAVDISLQIERLKGQKQAYKEMRCYIQC